MDDADGASDVAFAENGFARLGVNADPANVLTLSPEVRRIFDYDDDLDHHPSVSSCTVEGTQLWNIEGVQEPIRIRPIAAGSYPPAGLATAHPTSRHGLGIPSLRQGPISSSSFMPRRGQGRSSPRREDDGSFHGEEAKTKRGGKGGIFDC